MDAISVIVAGGAALLGVLLGWTLGRRSAGDDAGAEAQVALLKEQLAQSQSTAELSQKLTSDFESLGGMVQKLDARTERIITAQAESGTNLNGLLQQLLSQGRTSVEGISALRNIFANNQARGAWGQESFEGFLSAAGLVEGLHFTQQYATSNADGQARPDFIIFLPNDGKLVVDAKFPFTAIAEAYETQDETERAKLLKRHAEDLFKHAKSLKTRGYANLEDGPDFAVLYLPADALWADAIDADGTLLTRLRDIGVIPMTPATAIALLDLTHQVWQQDLFAKEAKEVASAAKTFVTTVARTAELLDKVHGQISALINGFNTLSSFMTNSLFRSANRLQEHGVKLMREIEDGPTVHPAALEAVKNLSDTIDIEPADEIES